MFWNYFRCKVKSKRNTVFIENTDTISFLISFIYHYYVMHITDLPQKKRYPKKNNANTCSHFERALRVNFKDIELVYNKTLYKFYH